MLQLYIGCLIFGALFAVVSVLLGDVLSTALDGALDFLSADYLNPTVLATFITIFGGTGIMLDHYAVFGAVGIFLVAALTGLAGAILIHLFYVKPMMNSENSTGYSIHGLTGKVGEVIVPIPANGYGEILVRTGAANSNQIAGSFEHTDIQAGDRVVIVEVKDGAVYVSRFENNSKGD
ncbi:NfeD family protein [Gorillibacterium timonense]|uniref:NfeD family protein n=1 Tax=Gorillibacterium timonense TaxID=1689269 RepID=UPI00071DC496|nr:NfeD family protein [Gorillibacterium timonense]